VTVDLAGVWAGVVISAFPQRASGSGASFQSDCLRRRRHTRYSGGTRPVAGLAFDARQRVDQGFLGADDGNRTRVFSLGSRFWAYSDICSCPLRSVGIAAITWLNWVDMATAVGRSTYVSAVVRLISFARVVTPS
jgi:hypothetical protein